MFMEETTTLLLDPAELNAPVPTWIAGHGNSDPYPTQLKMFLRWVCRIHCRTSVIRVAQALGYTANPFKSVMGAGVLEKSCYELALLLSRSLGMPGLDLADLTERIQKLHWERCSQGETGEWHTLASSLRDLWSRKEK